MTLLCLFRMRYPAEGVWVEGEEPWEELVTQRLKMWKLRVKKYEFSNLRRSHNIYLKNLDREYFEYGITSINLRSAL